MGRTAGPITVDVFASLACFNAGTVNPSPRDLKRSNLLRLLRRNAEPCTTNTKIPFYARLDRSSDGLQDRACEHAAV